MKILSALAMIAGFNLVSTVSLAGEDVVHRTANCGCCHQWTEQMRSAGIELEDRIVEHAELDELKAGFGLPQHGAACHTAEIDGYLVEGHVPAFAIERLLAERPAGVRGVVVPGMPPSSPGMGGPLVDYDIYLLTDAGELRPWLRARGSSEVAAESR